MKRLLKFAGLGVLVLALIAVVLSLTINRYQSEGELELDGLTAPVTVTRDQFMIPYIHASSMDDALLAQGFLTAQARTFQIQLYRLLALGRLSEVFGEAAINNDILIRLIDIEGLAAKQTNALDQQARRYYQQYVNGVNTYLKDFRHEHPIEVELLGFEPESWSLQDIVAIQLFQSWANGSAWKTDLINLQLIDEVGAERAQQIAQITINPEDGSRAVADLATTHVNNKDDVVLSTLEWLSELPNAMNAGSNAWATGNRLSKNGKPILANNPHLPVGNLPGFWMPMAIFTPELKVAGVHAPGSPGIGVGRNNHIAWGATVGGSDGADIYVEQLDSQNPDHYLQGQKSLPLSVRTTNLRIKDRDSDYGYRTQTVRMRSTPRGPLISDHVLAYTGGRALSLRWAARQTLSNPSLGSDRLLYAKDTEEAQQAMRLFPGALSHIAADDQGNIARVSSGRVPIRSLGDGAKPVEISALVELDHDNWRGLIPSDEMPKQINPVSDWVGTANHRIIAQDYPYQYSKNFASSWRYRRIQQFFSSRDRVDVNDHWTLINDVKNLLAEHLAPRYVQTLQNSHADLAKVLQQWDKFDHADKAAPALFQAITKHLAQQTFADELSPELWQQIFDTPYFWQERLVDMLLNNNHPWFDDQSTPEIETAADILARAIELAVSELRTKMGSDISAWQWGDIHTITFNSPVIPGKLMARLFGAGTHPIDGSGETLNRSAFKPSLGYDTAINDSVRLVVDLSDKDKLLAVIPGGVSARYFDPHLDTQTQSWLSGEAHPIYFSPQTAKQVAVSELVLIPTD